MNAMHRAILLVACFVALPGAAAPDHLSLALGRDTIDLIKVATCANRPALSHLGEEAFRRACASGNAKLVLFHLVLPNSLKGTRLRHHHGDSRFELPAPTLIYRMPTSPLRAFLVLAPGQAGSLEATTKDGQTATLELASRRDLLARMPLHWFPGSRDIHYHGLPSTATPSRNPIP